VSGPALHVDVERIERAADEIDSVFRGTPQFFAHALGASLGFRILLKLETANPVRSFKGRGGDWLARTAAADDVFVCASAGNLGQGIAYGARAHGLSAHVFAARTANPRKLAQMERLGAALSLVDGDFDDAKVAAADAANMHGWRLVEDGREPALAEGAATMAIELTRDHPGALEHVFVPVGNGSLACGVGTWLRAHSPATRLIGVGSEVAPATYAAWRTGDLRPGAAFTTVAEGLCARIAVPEAVSTLQNVLDDYLLVAEKSLMQAVRLLWRECGVIAEPSGAAALAGVLARFSSAETHLPARPSSLR
jgi:threonine dehydratase